MSGIFLDTWHLKNMHQSSNLPPDNYWKGGEKPLNPKVGDVWCDTKTFEMFVWAALETNVLDDIVAVVDDHALPARFGWMKVLSAQPGLNLFATVVDEVNFGQPDPRDDE